MIRFVPVVFALQVAVAALYIFSLQSSHWTFHLVEALKFGKDKKLESVKEEEAKIFYYEVRHFGKKKTCGQMMKAFKSSSFASAFARFLNNSPLSKQFYYVLFTPMQVEALGRVFTIVLIDASKEGDVNRLANPVPYQEYLPQCTETKRVMTFRSKSESNTLLVCPCRLKKYDNYHFIGSFFANAPASDRVALLAEIAKQILIFLQSPDGLQNIPLFISTHGLDVAWLHVRLESPLPKHYANQKIFYDRMP